MSFLADRRWVRLEQPLKAAQVFGQLVAQGLMEPRECYDALQAAGQKLAPDANPSGRSMVLAHALRDSIAEWVLARQRTQRAIHRIIEPLLAQRVSSADLLAAAGDENAAAGTALLQEEVRATVTQSVVWHLRAAARKDAAA